jgi:hypothetical protein
MVDYNGDDVETERTTIRVVTVNPPDNLVAVDSVWSAGDDVHDAPPHGAGDNQFGRIRAATVRTESFGFHVFPQGKTGK